MVKSCSRKTKWPCFYRVLVEGYGQEQLCLLNSTYHTKVYIEMNILLEYICKWMWEILFSYCTFVCWDSLICLSSIFSRECGQVVLCLLETNSFQIRLIKSLENLYIHILKWKVDNWLRLVAFSWRRNRGWCCSDRVGGDVNLSGFISSMPSEFWLPLSFFFLLFLFLSLLFFLSLFGANAKLLRKVKREFTDSFAARTDNSTKYQSSSEEQTYCNSQKQSGSQGFHWRGELSSLFVEACRCTVGTEENNYLCTYVFLERSWLPACLNVAGRFLVRFRTLTGGSFFIFKHWLS